MLSAILSSARYAFRQMRLAPVFTITVILTLGLGIGSTTAIFSLIHAVMLKSLPVADPGALYRIGTGKTCCYVNTPQGEWGIFSYAFYQRIRQAVPQFESIAAFQAEPHILSLRPGSGEAQAKALLGEYVSGNYFQTLGINAYAGRMLTEADDRKNAAPVAVMSYRTWQEQFGGNLSIVGTTFNMEGFPFTLIGIAPPGFFGETLSATPPSLWIPLQTEFLTDDKAAYNLVPAAAWLRLIGRLRPGATTAGVASQLTATLRHWLPTDADMLPGHQAELVAELPRQQIDIASASAGVGAMKDAYGHGLAILFAICGSVLLIACANIANLSLTRGISRRPQMAVRIALGASRRRLIGQSLVESTLLGLLGGTAGVAIAWLGARFAVLLAFRHSQADAIHVGLSWPMLGFCFGLALLSGLLFGTVPAWLSTSANPIEAVRGVNRSVRDASSPLRNGLVVLQTALSVALIAAAGMLIHGLMNIEGQDYGFSLQDRIGVRMEEPLAVYSLDHLNVLYRDLERRLAQLPGVHSAGLALASPFTNQWKQTVVKPGEGMPRVDGSQAVNWDRVSPGYFQSLGQTILRGRGIEERDNTSTRGVAVVNQAFVRRFYPNEDAVGKYFGFATPANSKNFEIVGVVGDAKYADPDQPAAPMVFAPLAQRIDYAEPSLQDDEKWSHFITGAQLWVTGDIGRPEPLIREAFMQVDPNFAIVDIHTMHQQVAVNFDQQRGVAQLSGIFGILALLLASIGLYGVTAYTVTRRTGEIGIRMAVGANRLHIVLLVLRGAFLQIAAGLILGVPAAVLIGRFLSSRLYGIGALDLIPLVAAAAALLFSAFIASIIPARRAASIEPLDALRSE